MTDTTLDTTELNAPKKRPVFLTVLCILTWVGSGLGFLGGLMSLTVLNGASETFANLERTSRVNTEFGTMPSLEEYIFWTNLQNITALLVAGLCIFGAILMWQLKKTGFFLYLAGCVISLVVSIMAIGVLMPSGLAGFGMIAVVIGGLISAAFIIMYAVNLKHMK